MGDKSQFYKYLDDNVSFVSKEACNIRNIYMPLCGTSSDSIKSSITPFLCGDIKKDKNHYLTKPVSTEDLRFYLRNFFCYIEGFGVVALAGRSNRNNAQVEIGQLYHKFTIDHKNAGIEISSVNFVPVSRDDVEVMQVTVKNISDKKITFTPTASIPVFARALSNKHDHEHVTSLLNRISQEKEGVFVSPTMLFNEEGHKECNDIYFVVGCEDKGKLPQGTFPTSASFYGDSGIVCAPEAVLKNLDPKNLDDVQLQGKEAMGALRFDDVSLDAGEEKSYFIIIGIAKEKDAAKEILKSFGSFAGVAKALEEVKSFWLEKSSSITFHTGNAGHDSWMRWVTIQPVLRRIFGCSFLPDHDYGKGGKGWRDIWQDLLSLILIEPDSVRETLINNCAGIRIDGSNATIIGSAPGEFVADRNAITRVWMDHGVWPFMTMFLYINQTGDFDILFENNTYFKDIQFSRTFEKDTTCNEDNTLKDAKGNAYKGSVIEHLILQNIVQFFNIGEHNIIRLESADWNDGLDMAFDRGESVTFTSAYAGNLLKMAKLLEDIKKLKGMEGLEIAKEILILLDTINGDPVDYNDVVAKKTLLFDVYFKAVQPQVSGEKINIKINDLSSDLERKGKWIFEHIKKNEKLSSGKYFWFNGYYDNKGKQVEGKNGNNIRMTLTGQVFPVMSGLADEKDIKDIVSSSNEFLKDKNLGGYRLNTDFSLRNYLDLGRAFGFAYGTKENGAFFSHMIVMYAYALYSRGFAREGYEVLKSIYDMCKDTQRSKIYPGIPEYFDSEGKGMYHYLTGAASWLVLTKLTEVFGVKGKNGNLMIAPKLVKEEFDDNGEASVTCSYAKKHLKIIFQNTSKKDYGQYRVQEVFMDEKSIETAELTSGSAILKREDIRSASAYSTLKIILK